MNFTEKLKQAISSSQSTLCVGLDPSPDQIPKPLRKQFSDEKKLVLEFCRRVIESTKIHACAFKPNTAFFEALGSGGWALLEDVADMIPSNRILIADAKRGDIGNTADKYREAFFNRLGADAITLNPLMGMDTLDPFLDDEEKAIYVLAMTSNSGAGDFLQRRFEGRMSLGEYIAEELSKRMGKSSTHLGMVIGATQIDNLQPVIRAFPQAHLLIPGVGAQGGSIEEISVSIQSHIGIPVINSSRAVIYAGGDNEDWEQSVSEKAIEMKERLTEITRNYV
jgi:orotidine-5'-phosphate decarboxylase